LLTTTRFPADAPTYFYVVDSCSPGNVYSLNGQNLPGLSSPQAGFRWVLREPRQHNSLGRQQEN